MVICRRSNGPSQTALLPTQIQQGFDKPGAGMRSHPDAEPQIAKLRSAQPHA